MPAAFRLLGLELTLAANRQSAVLHADVDILHFHVRHVGLHDQFVLGLLDVDRRNPRTAIRFGKQTVHGILEQPHPRAGKASKSAKGEYLIIDIMVSLLSNHYLTTAYNMRVYLSSICVGVRQNLVMLGETMP